MFRGTHAPSRAGDDALVIANLLVWMDRQAAPQAEACLGEGAETSTRGRVRSPKSAQSLIQSDRQNFDWQRSQKLLRIVDLQDRPRQMGG